VILESLENCTIHGVRHAEVIGMNYEQARRGWITETLLHAEWRGWCGVF
jgi:hypothetical protein